MARKDRSQMNRDHHAIIKLLEEKGANGATTTEMVEAGYNGYRGRISELRLDFGYDIICRYDGKNEEGRGKHRYWLGEFVTPARPVVPQAEVKTTYAAGRIKTESEGQVLRDVPNPAATLPLPETAPVQPRKKWWQ